MIGTLQAYTLLQFSFMSGHEDFYLIKVNTVLICTQKRKRLLIPHTQGQAMLLSLFTNRPTIWS